MSFLLFGMKLTFQSYFKVSFNYFLCASENESKLKNPLALKLSYILKILIVTLSKHLAIFFCIVI